MREVQTRIDAANMAMGVYGARTVQANRFEGDYSFETEIHPDDLGMGDDVPLTDPVIPNEEDEPDADTEEQIPADSGE
jgi:hypothetical protein